MLWQTLKITFIFIAVLVVGGYISHLMEQFASFWYHFPDIVDKESHVLFIDSLPAGIWTWFLLSHASGAFLTGFLLGRWVPQNSGYLFKFTALIWMFYSVLQILDVPHPLWFTISDLCLYYPLVYLGHDLSFRWTGFDRNS